MIEHALAAARARIRRNSPGDLGSADVVVVDTRAQDERERDGIIPGSVHVPLSVLEWRCDASSGHANPHLAGRSVVLVCAHGWSSSLAAARLLDLGVDAGDLEGGFEAWRDAGLPVAPAPPADGMPGMGGPQ